MRKTGLLVIPALLLFGCGGERSNVQTPLQLTYGPATQSNSNMNFQPSVIVGSQPLGKSNLVSSLILDVQDKVSQLSVLEEKAKQEIALPAGKYFISFPPPLNTSAYSAMRVAYPKEFLELDEATQKSFLKFYGELDRINNDILQRNATTHTALIDSAERIRAFDGNILEGISKAREAIKTLKQP